MKKLFLFIFLVFFSAMPARGVTLKVMTPGTGTPIDIVLHATKRTEHALAVRTASGAIYYADTRPVEQSFVGAAFTRIDGQIYQIGVAPAKFSIITTPDTSSFSFRMSAMGIFTVDWGDGETEEITRTDTTAATYSHTYAVAGKRTIGINGQATGYSTEPYVAAISFYANQNVEGIHGSLGAIFSTIGDGSGSGQQPKFYRVFRGNSNLVGPIPAQLFTGLHGRVISYMFTDIFADCVNLDGSIPKNLFADVTGPSAKYCFSWAFYNCAKLTGPIPEKLFAGISGVPASYMFWNTFYGCAGLSTIPENLFGDISGELVGGMFYETFAGCSGLSGPSAKINGKYLYEIWPDATSAQVGMCYNGDTGLSDWDDMPSAWK